jgi:hypothetical protein
VTALFKLLKSRAVARDTGVTMYRTIIRPVATYGSEIWSPITREGFEHGRKQD